MAFFFLSDSFMQQEHGKVRVGQRRQGRGGQSGQQRQEGGRTRAGQGRAGQGRAGQGRAGQGRAGQGRAGTEGQFAQTPLVPRRTCSGTGRDVGATVLMAVEAGQTYWIALRHRGRRA